MIKGIKKFFVNFLAKWLWWILTEKMKEERKILLYNPNEEVNQKNYQKIIEFLRRHMTVKVIQTLEELEKENIQNYDAVIYFHFVKDKNNYIYLDKIKDVLSKYPDLLLLIYTENRISDDIMKKIDNLYIVSNMPTTLISNLLAILFAKKL